MKKTTLLVSSLVLAPCLAGAAQVDLSRTLSVPTVKGLSLSPAIPTELDEASEATTFTSSIASGDLDAFLAQEGMPGLASAVTITTTTPQCSETPVTRSTRFELSVSDKDWLKSRGLFCRLERLFGGCKPRGPADLFASATLARAGDETHAVGATVLTQNAQCASDPSSNPSYDTFASCVGPNADPRPCLDPFASGELKFANKTWKVDLDLSESHVDRQAGAPLVSTQNGTRTLVSVAFGAGPLTLSSQGSAFGATLSIQDAFRDFGGMGPMSFAGTYANSLTGANEAGTGNPVATSATVVANFPDRVVMKASDIVSFESVDDKTSARSQAEQILEWCRTNTPSDDFAKFICQSSGPELVDLLAQKTEVRVHLVDQNGVARLLTFERPAPAEFCAISGSTLSCSLPDSADTGQWLKDPAKTFHDLTTDPTKAGTELDFLAIAHSVPRADGVAPLASSGFVTAQTRSLVLRQPQ
jgi:hypothetical protein